MLKSELAKHLIESIVQYGDGEITVEVTDNLNFEGEFYKIADLINTGSLNGDYDSILVETRSKFTR